MAVQKITSQSIYTKSTPSQSKAQTTFGINNSTQPKNNKKTKNILLAAIVLAVLGGIAYVKREALGLTKTIIKQSPKKLEEKINFLKDKYRPEATRVLNENTHNGMVNLGGVEHGAAIRSASPTEQDPFHQAASWIEEAYIKAYSKAQLSDGNNVLNYIHRRIGTENNTLAQIYAQMPKEECAIRLNQFANEAAKVDNHVGMTPEKFITSMTEKIIPKAKESLASK